MKLYHVAIEQDESWFIGRVLERDGVTTQGRSLDELVFMVRDAIQLMWDETDVQLELIIPKNAITSFRHHTLKKSGTANGGRKGTKARRTPAAVRAA